MSMDQDKDKDMLALPAEAELGGPKMPPAPPCYSDAGWLQRPDDVAYSFQFMRGLWERHERIFAIRRIGRDQAAAGERVWMAGVAHSATMPKCPSLMTIGQHDYIAVENAIDVHESCKRSGAPLLEGPFDGRNRGISRPYRQSDPGIRIRLAAAKLDSTERICRQRGRCV
jgi:hypothetical protein